MNALHETAQVLENGFCHGTLYEDGDKYCAVGALATALTGNRYPTDEAYTIVSDSAEGQHLASVIEEELGYKFMEEGYGVDDTIYDFNDNNSKDTVIAVVRKAADTFDN